MDQWWLHDEGEAIGQGRSPNEIFGTFLQDIDNDKEDHFLQRTSEIRRSTELTNTDYEDLETLLYNPRATCESPTSSHPEQCLLSPEIDQSNSPIGSGLGSEFMSDSPRSSQASPNHSHGLKGELCLESEVEILRQTPTSPEEKESCTSEAKESTVVNDRYVSDKKSTNEVKASETNTKNIHDFFNSFLAQCSEENAGGLFDEVLNLPKSCSPPSTSFVPPISGYVTPPCSPDFSRNVVTLPVVPLTREFNDVIRPRHTSEDSCLAPRPLLDALTSCSLSNTFKNIFHCQFCGREFKHKIGLKNHERSHLRGETHVCGYCGKSFRYKNKLRRHVNVHAREMRICRYCGEVQSNDYELVQHEKKHKKDDKKLIDEMMDSSTFTSNSSSSLDIVFTEGKSFSPENMMLSTHGCQEQPWTSLYMNTAITTGMNIHTFPKQMRYHSV